MSKEDREKVEIGLHARPLSDTLTAVPIKKRRFIYARSPSPPPQMPSPSRDSDVLQKKPASSEAEPPFMESVSYIARVTAMSSENGSCESKIESRNGGRTLVQETQPGFNDQISGMNVVATSVMGTSNEREKISNNHCAGLLVTGSSELTEPPYATEKPIEAIGNAKEEVVQNERSVVKQEKLEHHDVRSRSSDAKSMEGSAHVFADRSNWDLNTPMDSWEGCPTTSAINHGTSDRLDLAAVHDKRLESGHKQLIYRGPNEVTLTVGKKDLQKNNHQPNMPNLSTPASEHSNSDTFLELQLKPSFMPNLSFTSGKFDSAREMPFLSLSVKPMLSSQSPPLDTGRAIKSETNEGGHQETRSAESSSPKSIGLKLVKPEPYEGASKTLNSGDMKSAGNTGDMRSIGSTIVKKEPFEDQSQLYLKNFAGKSFHTEPNNQSSTSQNTEIHQDAGKQDSKGLDLASKSLVPVDIVQSKGLDLASKSLVPVDIVQSRDKGLHDVDKPKDSTDMICESLDLADIGPIPGNDFPTSVAFSQDGKIAVTEHAGLVPLISDSNEANSLEKACQTTSFSSVLLPESASSAKEHLTMDDREHIPAVLLAKSGPQFVTDMSSSDGPNLSCITSTDEVLMEPFGNSKVVDSDDVTGKFVASTGNREELCGSECKLDNSHSADGAVNTLRRQCGKDDEDLEDGEVRDLGLSGAVESSCLEREQQQVEDADPINPVAVPFAMPSQVDEKEIEDSKELEDQDTVEGGGSSCNDKDEPYSPAVGALAVNPGKRRLSKTVRKMPTDQPKDKALERKFKLHRDIGLKAASENGEGTIGSQQSDLLLAKVSISAKAECFENDGATKDANVKGNPRRIIYLNPASNRLASGNMKPTSGRPISSQIGRESATNKQFRCDRSNSQGSRDETCSERSRKVENERNCGQPVGKSGPELVRFRSKADERPNVFRSNRNSDSDHMVEQINSSTGIRFPRNASTLAMPAAGNGSGRLASKPGNGEMQNLSHFSRRRGSPGCRVQMPMVRNPGREISPSRCIGRDVPDFILMGRGQNAMRNMPDGMTESSIHSHQRVQYERTEDILVRRERRSLSPTERRGGLLHLSRNCVKSSPRMQHAAHQWSPPQRSPDGFNGPQEFVRCRSPQLIRLGRMRSPHQRPCFPEEMMVRRRGSPPYGARLPDDVMDIGPPRDHDFPRPVRGSHRNMPRFNLMDPREIAEDEYFGPPLLHGQMHEFTEEDEYDEDRRCEERRGPIRSSRQRYVAGDGEGFRFHPEDGPPRPFRLCPESNEGFSGGGSPRNFNGRLKNRLGNSSGRLRAIEEAQEGNFRHHGEQGLRDANFSDGRPKRRRF